MISYLETHIINKSQYHSIIQRQHYNVNNNISNGWLLSLKDRQHTSIREQSVQTITNNDLIWIDVQNPTRNIMQQLSEKYHFHELSIEDSLSKIEIPKIDKYSDHIFTTIHFPVMNDDYDQETTTPTITQLSIFIGSKYIITVHQGDLRPLRNMFDSCKEDKIQKEEVMSSTSSSGYLLHSIIDMLVDNLFHVLEKWLVTYTI